MGVPISGFVTTPELSWVGTVDLQETGVYRIVSVGPGAVVWRLHEVTSPYVHGSTLVGAAKERTIMPLTIMVEGSSHADLVANASVLARCFEQFSYRVGITWDNVDYEWECRPANYTIGPEGGFEGSLFRVKRLLFTAQVPRQPIPNDGAF